MKYNHIYHEDVMTTKKIRDCHLIHCKEFICHHFHVMASQTITTTATCCQCIFPQFFEYNIVFKKSCENLKCMEAQGSHVECEKSLESYKVLWNLEGHIGIRKVIREFKGR